MEKISISESIEDFSDYVTLNQAELTAKAYTRALKKFVEYLASKGITEGSPTLLLENRIFVSYPPFLLRLGLSKATVVTYLSALVMYHDWLIMNEMIPNPDYAQSLAFKKSMRDARKKQETKIIRHPAAGDAEKVIEHADSGAYKSPIPERNEAMLMFLFSSGCRCGEIVKLVVRDLDLSACQAVVTGKGNKQRYVYFDNKTADALREYWKVREFSAPEDPVFAMHGKRAGKKHKFITTRTVWNVVDDARLAAGLEAGKFWPHAMRHNYAKTMLKATSNLALVQDLLGHASPVTTRKYTKIEPEELRDAHHKVFNKED